MESPNYPTLKKERSKDATMGIDKLGPKRQTEHQDKILCTPQKEKVKKSLFPDC